MDATVVIKSPAMQQLEARLGQPLESFIRERYNAGADQRTIAAELGVDPGTVSKWMSRLGIQARRMGPRRRVA